MKLKTTILILTLSSLALFTCEVYGQDTDSVQRTQIKAQDDLDEARMDDVKDDRKETKAKAKEAKRVGREADDAAKQSKNALKAEKKAQKSRKSANQQAKKAEAARDKSDQN